MFNVNDIKNGMTILFKDNIFTVLEFSHVKPGKGAAIVKAKLKNLRTGSIAEYTFNAGIKVPTAHVEKQKMQFLYADGDNYSFMNMETYEQVELNKKQIENEMKFLKEGLEVIIIFFEGEMLGIELPEKIDFKITEIDFEASSFAGIGKSTRSGLQFVSTIAKVGIFNLRASATAMCSLLISTINNAEGKRVKSAILPKFLSNLARSRCTCKRSRLEILANSLSCIKTRLISTVNMQALAQSSRALKLSTRSLPFPQDVWAGSTTFPAFPLLSKKWK